jgi:hypothetical protein
MATFDVENKSPWKWDPESGERIPLPFLQKNSNVEINLNPHESILLVFDPELSTQKSRHEKSTNKYSQKISGLWKINFQPLFGSQFIKESNILFDLSKSEDNKISKFAGTINYVTDFEATNTEYRYLDLGEVYGVSEVILNGNHLGVRWYGKHVYELQTALLKGKNNIEIKITTVLLNYVKSLTDNETAQVWTKNQKPTSTGLVGPITLFSSHSSF